MPGPLPFEPPRVTVFCGSSLGARKVYREGIEALGRDLARRGLGLVYGGGGIGLMGVLADAVLREGGEVIGVIPRAFAERELAHPGLSELLPVEGMHERKARMVRLGGAFLAAPGGIGTLEELLEVATWAQIGLHDKPLGVLDLEGYFDPLFEMLQRAEAEGFLEPGFRGRLRRSADPEGILDLLARAPGRPAPPPG